MTFLSVTFQTQISCKKPSHPEPPSGSLTEQHRWKEERAPASQPGKGLNAKLPSKVPQASQLRADVGDPQGPDLPRKPALPPSPGLAASAGLPGLEESPCAPSQSRVHTPPSASTAGQVSPARGEPDHGDHPRPGPQGLSCSLACLLPLRNFREGSGLSVSASASAP